MRLEQRLDHPQWASAEDTRGRIVLALLQIERPTISAICEATGRNRSTVHGHLVALRDDGIVDWRDGRKGTLHLTVRPVPFG